MESAQVGSWRPDRGDQQTQRAGKVLPAGVTRCERGVGITTSLGGPSGLVQSPSRARAGSPRLGRGRARHRSSAPPEGAALRLADHDVTHQHLSTS